MDDETGGDGLRERLTRQGEDALGRLAQDLLENPLINGAIARAFEAREKAAQAQEVAFGAFNIPSASDIERLTRRVRSVSQRLEGIEDGVDRLDERLAALQGSLDAITKELAELRKATPKQAPARRPRPSRRRAPPESGPHGHATDHRLGAVAPVLAGGQHHGLPASAPARAPAHGPSARRARSCSIPCAPSSSRAPAPSRRVRPARRSGARRRCARRPAGR